MGPSLPDLTPLDFFLCSYVFIVVCQENFADLQALRCRIAEAEVNSCEHGARSDVVSTCLEPLDVFVLNLAG
jgi:hypothetical protein